MKYLEFIGAIQRTQSAFEPTRKRAVEMLSDFWMSDRGTQFGIFIQRMSDDLQEQAHQRQRRNRWL